MPLSGVVSLYIKIVEGVWLFHSLTAQNTVSLPNQQTNVSEIWWEFPLAI